MKLLLEEIQSIPGIIGSFVFNGRQHVVASDLPAVFKEQKLVKIGKMVMKLFSNSKANFPDISELSLFYEESHVIVREIQPATYLIVLCTPTVNLNLLTMTMNLIMEDLALYTGEEEPLPPDIQTDPVFSENEVTPPSLQHQVVSSQSLMENGPLSETLNGMQKALAKVAGPMAKIIFAESLDTWSCRVTPSAESLGELVEILKEELSDPDKSDYYEKLIRGFITPQGKSRNLWRGGQRHIKN